MKQISSVCVVGAGAIGSLFAGHLGAIVPTSVLVRRNSTNARATQSLVYRSLLRSIREGLLVPGAKLPHESDLAQQLNTSRTATLWTRPAESLGPILRHRSGDTS